MITAKKALLHLDAKGLVVELFIANEIEPEIRRVYEKDTEITLKVHKWSYGNWIFDKLYSEKYIDYNVDRESVTKAIVKELSAYYQVKIESAIKDTNFSFLAKLK